MHIIINLVFPDLDNSHLYGEVEQQWRQFEDIALVTDAQSASSSSRGFKMGWNEGKWIERCFEFSSLFMFA